MAIKHNIPELDRDGLREFGLTTGAAIVIIFGLFFPWILELNWPVWPWVIAAPLWFRALVRPSWLRWIYRAWMRFGLLLNKVTTPLVLGVVFFLLILPVGLVRRALGKDSIPKGAEPEQDSYRVTSDAIPKESLERPF